MGEEDTYALALVVHADLLERHDLLRLRLRLRLLRHEHLTGNNRQMQKKHRVNAAERS
jgi:hypothetical protein